MIDANVLAVFTVLAHVDVVRKAVDAELQRAFGDDYGMTMEVEDEILYFRTKQGVLLQPQEALGSGLARMIVIITTTMANSLVRELERIIQEMRMKRCDNV